VPAPGTFDVRLREDVKTRAEPTVCESCGVYVAPVFLHFYGEDERPGWWEYTERYVAVGEHTPDRCRELRGDR
jgi:hypothetical protein